MTDVRSDIERLVQRISESEEALQALLEGEVDAVVNPASALPILLSHAQRALSESEARYRDLISRCPALVCELSRDGRMLFANDALRMVLGCGTDAADLPAWDDVVPPAYLGDARQFVGRLRRDDVSNYELPIRAAHGEPRWILWTTANRYADDGDLETIIAFGLDITERKQAEEVAQRVTDAQLARTRAEAANKAKMEFLAVMSHELRTPLNAIGGYTELLEMGVHGPVSGEQEEALRRIRRSQRHLLGLINDLMNFARLEAGHVRVVSRDVPVNELLAVVDALTAPQVAAKGLDFVTERCDPALTVHADKEKVQQILINLVSNAVKFTPAGGRISIACSEDAHAVRLHVADTGAGIPPDRLAEIFEPFVQIRTGFTRPHDGVGLGLAISRDLARMMGGDVSVESTEGGGSRFTLVLPRHAPAT